MAPEYDVEGVRKYIMKALIQAQYRELEPSIVMRELYHYTYMRIFNMLKDKTHHWECMVAAAQAAIRLELGEDKKHGIRDGLTFKELLDSLRIPEKWENTDLLFKIVNSLPEDDKRLALVLLQRYEMYLLFYNTAVKLEHSPMEDAASEVTEGHTEFEVTVAKDLDEISRMDCELVLRLLSKVFKIPRETIKIKAFWSGKSTTIAFIISEAFMQNIYQYLFEGNSTWAFKELGVTRVGIPGLFEVTVSQQLTRHFKEALRRGLTGDLDFVGVTKVCGSCELLVLLFTLLWLPSATHNAQTYTWS